MQNYSTQCCIVGAGPAGAMLALLLARRGVRVTLLEACKDFDRDFRGDALIPGVMEIMEQLGLAENLLKLRHEKVFAQTIQTESGHVALSDYGKLKTRYPYLTIIPQAKFLEFLANEARQYPNFELIMGAHVGELVVQENRICGVRFQSQHGRREIQAALTVGADGRSSRLRRLAGFEPVKKAALMDVIWFRLPRYENDNKKINLSIRAGNGFYLGCWERFESWQCNLNFKKGRYPEIRAAGLDALRRSIKDLVPELADRVNMLKDWSQISFLSIETNLLKRWYGPGLLFIGDAAHAMSSVGGVGINCAIQDAVAAANVLAQRLRAGRVEMNDLAKVQRLRQWSVRVTQILQAAVETQVIGHALKVKKTFKIPLALRLPWLKDLASRVAGFGVWPVHITN